MTKLSVFDPMWYVLVVCESDKDFINKCTSVSQDHFLATEYLQLCLTQDGLLSRKQPSPTNSPLLFLLKGFALTRLLDIC